MIKLRERMGGKAMATVRGFSMGNVLGLRPSGVSWGAGTGFANKLFSQGSPRVHGRFFMGKQNRGAMSGDEFWGRYHALKGGVMKKGLKF